MRTLVTFFIALVMSSTIHGQAVATFDTLHLPSADTFYVNYSASGTDVGFNDGLAHFPCIYDTSYGGIWTTGFAYSNMTDSATSGFGNQYSAKTALGYGGSANYVVAHCSDPVTFAPVVGVKLLGTAAGLPVPGFYVTNSTYAYNSMRDGDMFARKFHNGDWFMLTVQGYNGGVLQPTSVSTYLADFLFPDSTMNYILKSWQWVNLSSLGAVDSLVFSLSSTDNGAYGMNTPAYFCMDNFTTNNSALSVPATAGGAVKVYPNPVFNMLFVDVTDNSVKQVRILDMSGRVLYNSEAISGHMEINTSNIPAGTYLLEIAGEGRKGISKFVKQ